MWQLQGLKPDRYIHLLLQPRHFGFDGTSAGGCGSVSAETDRAEVNGSDETFLRGRWSKVD